MHRIKSFLYYLGVFSLAFLSLQCAKEKKNNEDSEAVSGNEYTLGIAEESFGMTEDSTEVEAYTLTNVHGMQVEIITYGGIITRLKVPDKNGELEDVVLGFDALDQYIKDSPYFGAIIGRYGNRIAKGSFTLDDVSYTLAINNDENHLHGGLKGFDKVVWQAKTEEKEDAVALELSYLSKDMEEGYPGNLACKVTYTLSNDNALEVLYEATTDKKTVLNLTQHSYFNLSGDFSSTILDHEVSINANSFLPVDSGLIPTGEFQEVANTPFDFREPKMVGLDIDADDEQINRGRGYDHCWVLNEQDQGLRIAATAYHEESGRFLEVFSDQPGIQFYTGNFLDGSLPNKQGGTYAQRSGFCLETQHYPDSPNQMNFPSVVLEPGETYLSNTTFKFSVK